MSGKMSIQGMQELTEAMDKLSVSAQQDLLKRCVYPAAGIMADRIRAAVESLPTAERNVDGVETALRAIEKAGLLHGMGISEISTVGSVVSAGVGFHGYNKRGKSNAMIANSLDSGTSFMPADTRISRAERAAKNACLEAMTQQLSEEIDKIFTKGG